MIAPPLCFRHRPGLRRAGRGSICAVARHRHSALPERRAGIGGAAQRAGSGAGLLGAQRPQSQPHHVPRRSASCQWRSDHHHSRRRPSRAGLDHRGAELRADAEPDGNHRLRAQISPRPRAGLDLHDRRHRRRRCPPRGAAGARSCRRIWHRPAPDRRDGLFGGRRAGHFDRRQSRSRPRPRRGRGRPARAPAPISRSCSSRARSACRRGPPRARRPPSSPPDRATNAAARRRFSSTSNCAPPAFRPSCTCCQCRPRLQS